MSAKLLCANNADRTESGLDSIDLSFFLGQLPGKHAAVR